MRKMGILNKLNYQAGLLNDGASTEEVVVTPEEQAELIADSAEVVTNPEVAETEVLLNEIVAEDEVINEELAEVQEEQAVVAEGLQSDFTAVTTRSMIKSIEKINARYGEGSILTAGMQSDRFGGHKDLYVAGLQAKENFLKNAAKNVWALIQTMIQKIKELITKGTVWLNNDASKAEKLLKVVKDKKAALKEGVTELTEDEQKSIASKFAAWLSTDSKLEDYISFSDKVLRPLDVRIKQDADGVDVIEIMNDIADINKTVKKNKDIAADSSFSTVVSVAGSAIKYLAIEPEKGTLKMIEPEKGILKMSTVTVSPDSVMEKVGKKIPSLDLLHDFATQAVVLSKKFKNTASQALKYMEEVKKGLGDLTEGEGFAIKKSYAIATSQSILATIDGYVATQRSMIWLAGTFINKYQGPDAKADEGKK